MVLGPDGPVRRKLVRNAITPARRTSPDYYHKDPLIKDRPSIEVLPRCIRIVALQI